MVKRDEITQAVENIIGIDLINKAKKIDQYGANGVQFHGATEVSKVALGVSLNLNFLKEAASAGAQYCIFHHGLDNRAVGMRYSQSAQLRLRQIIKSDLTISAYHYSLDAQPEFGNNHTIARLLGAKVVDTLYGEWGVVARLKNPESLDTLSSRCAEILSHDILAIKSTNAKVQTIGIVAGGGKPYQAEIEEMHSKGVQLYISGESSESRLHVMQEEGISYFLGGHYATEVFGVQELGKKLKNHFKNKLEVEFIDIPNPL